MDKEELHKLINADDLNKALQLLINQHDRQVKPFKLLYGRLANLDAQNSQGTISSEAYNLERNRIRASLLNLIENEHALAAAQKPSLLRLALLIFGILIISVASVLFFSQKSKNKDVGNQEIVKSENTDNQQVVNNNDNTEIIEAIRHDLTTQNIPFNQRGLSFSQIEEYRVGLAYLKRKYDWEVDVPLEIVTTDAKVDFIDSLNKLVVNVSVIKALPSFYISDKSAQTLANSLWAEETAKDGAFWESINSLTKLDINNKFKADKNLRTQVKEIAINMIREKIERSTFIQSLSKPIIEINIGSMELYDGLSLPFE